MCTQTSLSIIIPTYNRYSQPVRAIDHLVCQILAHELAHSVEVLVVDDGSKATISSQVRNAIRRHNHHFLRFVRLSEHRGASAARNAGVGASEGQLLAFLDDDIVPADDYICAVITAHRQHPEALVINGNLLPLRDDIYSRFWFYYYNAVFNQPGKRYYAVDMISAGNVSIKKRLLDLEHPLFDTSLTSCEDLDLYFRLKRRGATVYKDDSITGFNDCRASSYAFLKQRLWWAQGQEEVVARYGMAWIANEQKSHAVPVDRQFARLYLLGRVARQTIRSYNAMRRLLDRVAG